ncbi:DUF3060 domain-containing protein [Galactobacter caseinivorans]|uniref:DUF3060 domain-containing protein n=1 Tax=Galactobacter caseinivorans TaxID=2676123 RepID=A0A496PKE9_9MICC|nr:DUF3060 domain-containing protein [Galactobacter caseinivorans]
MSSGSPTASAPSSSQRTAAAGDLAGQAMEQAGILAASKSTTVDCSSGAAQVSQDGAVVRIKGECNKLTVSAIGALVIADSIGSLDVTGTGVAVAAGSLKRLTISGTGTMISYAGTPPAVEDRGSGSAVSSDPLTD